MHSLPTTEPELDAFLHAFESGTLAKERWTSGRPSSHRSLLRPSPRRDRRHRRMRHHVRRYNEAVDGQSTPTSGDHETITVFWIKAVDALLR